MEKCSTETTKSQVVYLGIDVHSKQWNFTEILDNYFICTKSVPASARQLAAYVKKKYGETIEFRSAYEAGCCGFHIHRDLMAEGIRNIVVNPADIPTSVKERMTKNDAVDSRKLARELSMGSLKGIYIPPLEQERLRSLSRRETQIVHDIAREKNRIKSHLLLKGRGVQTWSKAFLALLKADADKEEDYTLVMMIDRLTALKEERRQVRKYQKQVAEKMNLSQLIERQMSIPGIGWRTAIALVTEIWDMTRFPTPSQLCSYVGLCPHPFGSGEHVRMRGAGPRKNKSLHWLLVEAAWMAIRKDNDLLKFYMRQKQKKCNCQQKAICAVARKLLLRIRAVWLGNKDYVISGTANSAGQQAGAQPAETLSQGCATETCTGKTLTHGGCTAAGGSPQGMEAYLADCED